jgi:hypothetical protein
MDKELAELEAAARDYDSDPIAAEESEETETHEDESESAPETEEITETETEEGEEPKVEDQEKADSPPKGEKAKSPYALQKELKAERAKLDSEWKKFRETSQSHKAEISELRQQIKQLQKQGEYSPDDWLRLAEQMDAEGRFDVAEKARQKAAEVQQNSAQEQSQEEFAKIWTEQENEIAEFDSEFADPESALGKAISAILRDPQVGHLYSSSPYGIRAAYDRVKLNQMVNYANAALAKISEQEAEIKKLKSALAPVSSGIRGEKRGDSFAELSDEEQYQRLLEAAEIEDSGAYANMR